MDKCFDPLRLQEFGAGKSVQGLRERGYATPVLLHFSDLLATSMTDLRHAFDDQVVVGLELAQPV